MGNTGDLLLNELKINPQKTQYTHSGQYTQNNECYTTQRNAPQQHIQTTDTQMENITPTMGNTSHLNEYQW
jgi:hypothetical protein